ncbi:MAG: hypothetical protein HY717_12465 [Planctomycetes bacterium]|nr:hypothetical protein [Planctomycetota bacterium]
MRLHFAEIYYQEAGSRSFDLRIESKTRLEDFDPFREAGGFAAAIEHSIDTTS